MQLIQPFDAQQFDPSQSAGALPIGKHPVVIESSEVKANKANDGGYLQLNLRIVDGPQTGTTGAYRLNLYHSNQTTVEIANRQLSAICHVIGVYQVSDSSQLHGIPFIVEVGPQKNDPQYTEVKKVFDANGNEPGRAGAAQAAQQPQAQQPAQQPTAWSQPAQQPAQAEPQAQQPQTAWAQPHQPAQQQPAQQQQPQAGWVQQPAQQQAAPAGMPWSQPR